MSAYDVLDSNCVDLGRSYLYLPDFECSIKSDDQFNELYKIDTPTLSGTFETSDGDQYSYEINLDFIVRKLS